MGITPPQSELMDNAMLSYKKNEKKVPKKVRDLRSFVF